MCPVTVLKNQRVVFHCQRKELSWQIKVLQEVRPALSDEPKNCERKRKEVGVSDYCIFVAHPFKIL